jgi:hypothetical protein
MRKAHRGLLAAALTVSALSLFGAPTLADAESRRHVYKPGDAVVPVTRDTGSSNDGAPEINGTSLALGLALAVGGLAILSSRRRSHRA